jgi:hypothetical protein
VYYSQVDANIETDPEVTLEPEDGVLLDSGSPVTLDGIVWQETDEGSTLKYSILSFSLSIFLTNRLKINY